LTVADPRGTIRFEGAGRCSGRIRFEPAGGAGFGYDALFEVAEYHRTVAELGDGFEAALSHRA
jgi:XTP/dITP diphosphohydrolase